MMVASAAEVLATIRLSSRASMTKVLFAALPYQVRAKCWKSLALLPLLKLKRTISAIGA
jgi:hypothetical protein